MLVQAKINEGTYTQFDDSTELGIRTVFKICIDEGNEVTYSLSVGDGSVHSGVSVYEENPSGMSNLFMLWKKSGVFFSFHINPAVVFLYQPAVLFLYQPSCFIFISTPTLFLYINLMITSFENCLSERLKSLATFAKLL